MKNKTESLIEDLTKQGYVYLDEMVDLVKKNPLTYDLTTIVNHNLLFRKLEKGKTEGGVEKLSPLELELYNNGYQICSDFMINSNRTKNVHVYKDDELFCEITHYCTCDNKSKIVYYKNDVLLKTVWYLVDDKLIKTETYYDEDGFKLFYWEGYDQYNDYKWFDLEGVDFSKSVLYKRSYKYKQRNSEGRVISSDYTDDVVDESELQKYFSDEEIQQ
jgi:hypothetical protein